MHPSSTNAYHEILMINNQTKDDLVWLLTRLGWTNIGEDADGILIGTPSGWRDEPHYSCPRYDQDVNLMIELVEGLDESQWRNYLSILAGIVRPRDCFDWQQKLGVIHDMVQAPAHLRLRAYRMVMEGK